MAIGSVNLSLMPFTASCDSTRANMATRQLAQSLTHKNCDIPYVISSDWRSIRDNSSMGICLAKDDGEVLYSNNEIMIIFYPSANGGKGILETKRISQIKKTHSNFSSSLRFAAPAGTKFNKDDILFEYDAFKMGYPTFGYNVPTMYTPFFGFNHEDSVVLSQSFANRARHKLIDREFVPIFEFTLFQKIYDNELKYFPNLGEKIQRDTICTSLLPSDVKNTKDFDPASVRGKVVNMLQGMNLSDLINMKVSGYSSGFSLEKIKSKIENGKVVGLKIHRIRKNVTLIDKELQKVVEDLHNVYGKFVLDTYTDLSNQFNEDFAKSIMKRFYVYADRDKTRGKILLNDIVYLIEFEIEKEYCADYGDKFANRYANKGVISLILPNELRPIALESNTPIDFVYNPFGRKMPLLLVIVR